MAIDRLKRLLRHIDPGFLIVLAICVVAVWPFVSRPSLPQETDAELHIFRLAELSHLVRGGELYPRWAPDFYHGYGYPIFNYYAPLTYYVGLVVELMPRLGPVAGVKAVFVLGLVAAAWGMYGFVRDNWGRPAGYVAAAVYVYAPYLQYVDSHARGVLAESFSFGVFPLALWSLDRLRRGGGPWNWLAAVVAVAAVILTHNLMGLLFFSLLFAWLVWQGLSDRWQQRHGQGHSAVPNLPLVALWLGLGLAAFFWLPVFLEGDAVNLSTLIGRGDNFDFRTHFLTWSELLAFSKPLDWGASQPAFRFNLGVAQWLLGGLGLLLLIGRRVKQAATLTFFVLALAVLLFLMLPASVSVWEQVPFLPYFQFPWRLLGAAVAMLAILAGAGTEALLAEERRRHKGKGRMGRAAITAGLVAFPMVLGLPLSQPAPWPDFGDVSLARMSDIENTGRWLGTTSTADFVPATVQMMPSREGSVVKGLYEGTPVDRVNWAVVPEGATVETETVTPLFTRYYVSTPQDFLFRLFLFDFPGWQARIDGQAVETELGRPEGLIVVPVPAGDHVVEVKFGSTPARSLALAISAVSLLVTGMVAWRLSRGRRRVANRDGSLAIDRLATLDRVVLSVVLGIVALFLFLFQPLGWLHTRSTGFTAVPASNDVFADFGEQIAFIGFDTSSRTAAPGDTIDVTLYWKAQRPLDINYQVFLHVLAADGSLVAQSDKLNPGQFPTRRWPLDKYVWDEHHLQLPPDLPAGEYTVATGLWVQSEGWRLPVLDEKKQQVGDNYVLFKLSVAGQ